MAAEMDEELPPRGGMPAWMLPIYSAIVFAAIIFVNVDPRLNKIPLNVWLSTLIALSYLCLLPVLPFGRRSGGLLIDEHYRFSLPRLQATCWLLILLSGLITVSSAALTARPGTRWPVEIEPNVLLAIGIAVLSLALAAATPVPEMPRKGEKRDGVWQAKWRDLLSDDRDPAGATDPLKVQLLAVTVVVLGSYALSIGMNLSDRRMVLPELGPDLLWLLAISHAAFHTSRLLARIGTRLDAELPKGAYRTTGTSPSAIKVADIRAGACDRNGKVIETVYARNAPWFAIYHVSEDMVLVHHADDPAVAQQQRVKLGGLLELRGEIDGLIHVLRESGFGPGKAGLASAAIRAAIAKYRRREADALMLALEVSTVDAARLLEGLRDDIRAQTAASANRRAITLAAIVALGVAAIGALVATWLPRQLAGDDLPAANRFLFAAVIGAIGAFSSIAFRRDFKPAPIGFAFDAADVAIRIVVGLIAAFVVHALTSSGVITLGFGSLILAGGELAPSWAAIAAMSFVAGFAERLVPSTFAQVAMNIGRGGTPLLAAAATSAALADLRDAVKETVDRSLSGEDLVRYDGYVSATFAWEAGADGKGSLRLRFDERSHEGSARLSLGDGLVRPSADFTIHVEPEDSPLKAVRSVITVPTTGQFNARAIPLDISGDTDVLWVKLLQGQRLLQMIEVTLRETPEDT